MLLLIIGGELNQLTAASLVIFDVNGKKVMHLGTISINKVEIQQKKLSKGSYFYQVRENSQLISQGKFVIQ